MLNNSPLVLLSRYHEETNHSVLSSDTELNSKDGVEFSVSFQALAYNPGFLQVKGAGGQFSCNWASWLRILGDKLMTCFTGW